MRTLPRRVTVAAVALVAGLTVSATSATAAPAVGTAALTAPVTVTLTVTGPNDVVLFDDEVETTGHVVTPLTEDPHLCDGTNAGANQEPGATPTAALDDSGLDWDGTWYPSFDDYLVSEIDGVAGTGTEFWLISVNGTATSVGGCQHIIEEGDVVSFTWTDF